MGKLPQNVADALSRVHMMVDSESGWADIDIADWQAIRAHLMSQEAEIARLNRLWESMTNLAVKKDSQIKIAESRLAAANALLLYVSRYLDPRHYDRAIKKIQSHLQGDGDEA